MLSKVNSDAAQRWKSNLLMHLAVHNPFETALNALMVSWLDNADWFQAPDFYDFPFDQEPRAYSEAEILERQEQAREKLHLYTDGLLEMATVGAGSKEQRIP